MTRQEAIEVLKHTIAYESDFASAKQIAIEALETRAEGEWKITNTYKDHSGRVVDRVEHTDCGYIWNREMGEPLHNYCPNCGAKMKGADDGRNAD